MKVTVNEKDEYQVDQKTIDALDIVPTGQNKYHWIYENRSYTVHVLDRSVDGKQFKISINGIIHEARVEDRYDALLHQLGMDNLSSSKALELKAPMPGLVLDVQVNVGDVVSKGDGLIVLEAMKMENVLKASDDGTIKSIKASKGDSVNKNDVLIEFES